MADTVKVLITFSPDRAEEGKTKDVDKTTARRLVREGRARYATEAQERKAEK